MEVPAPDDPLRAIAGTAALSARRGRGGPEVVVGAGIGVAIALGTRRFWPVAPHESAEARTVACLGARHEYKGGRTAIVVNANAGSPLAGNAADRIRESLPDAEVIVVEDASELDAALERAAEAEIMGVCGGDGTVNAAAGVARDRAKPLLVSQAEL